MTNTNTAVAAARSAAAPRARTDHLSGTQKAAIILRVLLAEGVDLPLSSLPEQDQTALTRALASLRLIDRPTMWAVVDEFVEMLEQVGMSFPESMEEALALLDGKLDDQVSTKLRTIARGGPGDDPWTAIELADLPALTAILQRESTVVGAVVLSKLNTEKAAALLTALPGELAQTLALAVARTDSISPDAVSRIGLSLSDQLRDKPPRAFTSPSAQRIGDILNSSPSALRDRLLSGLEQSDETLASGVRQSIFTFQDIPKRVGARDVPALLRNLADEDLHLILAADDGGSRPTMDFMLENISKRVAEGLREDAATLPRPSPEDLDAAQSRVSAAIRAMADAGDLQLVPSDGAT